MSGIRRLHVIATVAMLMLIFALLLSVWLPAGAASGSDKKAPRTVPGKYIVVFKDSVADPQAEAGNMASTSGLGLGETYDTAIKGYAADIPADKLDEVRNDPRVQSVSEDRIFSVAETGATRKTEKKPPPVNEQVISYAVERTGLNPTNKGKGIGVAILDTGIDLDHPDLAGNIVANYNAIDNTKSGDDDMYHGTMVAGLVAAIDNNFGYVGVAPEARLIAVKVLDSNGIGEDAQLIAGVEWVTKNAARYNIRIANMSWGGYQEIIDNNCGYDNNDPLHQAICASTRAGVTYVVSAGNEGDDVSNYSPAGYDDTVITVAALADTDGLPGGLGPQTSCGLPYWAYADDTFTEWSNYGAAVDLGAPGACVATDYIGGIYARSSGTSFASPLVAGAAALYIKSHPGASFREVRDELKKKSHAGSPWQPGNWQRVRSGLLSVAEPLGFGHTDPLGLHPEPVVNASKL